MKEGNKTEGGKINKPELGTDQVDHSPDNAQIHAHKSKRDLSATTIVASACAAVTASMLTSKLTGYLNSIAIVAVTSIVIAIASEVYSRVLKKMRKMSAKALTIMPLPEQTQRRLEIAAADTAQIEPIIITKPTSSTFADNDDNSTKDGNAIPHKTVRSGLRSIVDRLSWTTRMIIMVMIIAIMSIGASWLMATIIDSPNVTNVTENVTRKEVVNLSDSEKKAIQDAAVNAVQDEISSLTTRINDQSYKIVKLDNRISDLESSESDDNSNSSSSPSPSTGSSGDTSSQDDQDKIDSLNNQITELKKSVSSLQNEVNTLKSGVSSAGKGNESNSGSSSKE